MSRVVLTGCFRFTWFLSWPTETHSRMSTCVFMTHHMSRTVCRHVFLTTQTVAVQPDSTGGGSGPELSQQVKFTLIRLTWSPAASQCRVNSAVFIIFNTQEESDTITPALTSIDKPEHYASSTRLSCSWSTGRQSDRKRNASDAKCFSVTTSTDAPQPAGENDAIVAGNRSWGSFCSKKIIQATNGKKNKGG